MSLSRSPSPVPGGGWSSPGLNINSSGRSSPIKASTSSGTPVIWESARLKTMGGVASTSGYPSFSTHNQGFFTRHMRKLSSSLPRFATTSPSGVGAHHYAEKEKLGRGRWSGQNVPFLGRVKGIVARMGRKMKIRLLICLVLLLSVIIFYNTRSSTSAMTALPGHQLTSLDLQL